MRLLVFLLSHIRKFSVTYPRLVIAIFLAVGMAGFCTMPLIKVSSNLIAGVGEADPVIQLHLENGRIFGEQDSLIVVLEFPENPGEDRLPFIRALGESIAELPGVRRVRYQFFDPDNLEQVSRLFKNFLLGMNEREREQIQRIFTPEGIANSLRRNKNRLFLTENPYLQERILDDPLEMGRFAAEAMKKRVGSLSLGDVYLLIASPDSTLYLIQVTPDFISTDIFQGELLLDRLHEFIPQKITALLETMPELRRRAKDLTWYLTGKTAFHYESDNIFEREAVTIVVCSATLVLALLLGVFRSFWSAVLLMVPLAAGIGPNYPITYLSYDEINPVVSATTAVLLGLGTEYGVHLWGRLREEMARGSEPLAALTIVYEQTGPSVVLGGMSSILAFLCLYLSNQPAIAQFGYVGAIGLVLTLVSTLFLFPALVTIVAARRKDYFPKMYVSFKGFSGLFLNRPGAILIISALVVSASLFFVPQISYEKDLFKVFLARDMDSMAVSRRISNKFQSNFAQPTVLSFDTEDLQEGLVLQRRLDAILEKLMATERKIASFDSISYLMAPDAVQAQNIRALSLIADALPETARFFDRELRGSDLSAKSVEKMEQSFESTTKIIQDICSDGTTDRDDLGELERSWYMATIKGKYRFLTQIRYAHNVTDTEQLRAVDRSLMDAVKDLPVKVNISGTRQAMEAIVSTLVSELFRLGLYAYAAVSIIFFVTFPNPLGVALCLLPLTGAFCLTFGVMGALGIGLPFSIVGVAPLIFGLGVDNGIHVVVGSLKKGGAVAETMKHVTGPIIFTSLTNVLGFVAMLTSKHYALEFLGWATLLGMGFSVALTLTTLPALLLALERRRKRLRGL